MPAFLLLQEGRFGEAVASRLSSMDGFQEVSLASAMPALDDLVSVARFVGVVLSRRDAGPAAAVDDACARHAVPWSSAVLHGSELVLGPLVSPGRGPCHACYRRRSLCHRPSSGSDQLLEAAFAADPRRSIRGFLPGAVAVAAAGLRQDCIDPRDAPGRVRYVDILRCRVVEGRVLAIHGCPRCRAGGSGPSRYTDRLMPALERILS
jgi:bacteriocin biosynthesis cyclodehydratase domain-containing protein